jgi:hypothetical protein
VPDEWRDDVRCQAVSHKHHEWNVKSSAYCRSCWQQSSNLPLGTATPMSDQLMPDERRALELISAEATGCPEHLLVARGFNLEFLSGLVRSGLIGVTSETVGSGDMVFHLWVTERGRKALQAAVHQGS